MVPHDILTLYSDKAVEYLLAVAFLLSFIPFWRYATGERRAPEPAMAHERKAAIDLVEWFRLAREVGLHPGHSWLRREGRDLVTVGIDDFAQKLVGPIEAFDLPAPGTRLFQGVGGWKVRVGAQAFDVASPVDGTVRQVNERVLAEPSLAKADPYGEGWLLVVEAPRLKANEGALLWAADARAWLREATDRLRRGLTPELGLVLQDGGVPVDGLAQAIDKERWPEIVREHLRSQDPWR